MTSPAVPDGVADEVTAGGAPALPPAVRRLLAPLLRFRRIVGKVPTPLIFLGVIVVALAVLWARGSLGEIVETVRTANRYQLVGGAVLFLAGLALNCLRWHILVILIAGRSDLPRAAEAFLTSVALNYVSPVSVAIPARAALTKRAIGLSFGQTSTVAAWELLADVLILAAGATLWLLLAPASWSVLETIPTTLLFALGAVIAVGIAGVVILALRSRVVRAKAIRAAGDLFLAPRRRPGVFAVAMGVTLLYWLTQGAVLWVLLDALNADHHIRMILGMATLPWLVGMASMVPGGTGVREAMMVAVAGVEGAAAAPALVAAVSYRICMFLAIPVLYGVLRLWLRNRPRPTEVAPTEA
ncbi:MAG TPA: lysylphosphatidylglycerol synthase transmembrane domain-containing protein [Thermomicrobiales bacterium]|jgi:uncharacterized membrane protein YbhN (UPF0104 family)|nr:lysylphosphatidylglycerol synthase transmembrane domain-containing protein [Thermomicrobiales bacterium]